MTNEILDSERQNVLVENIAFQFGQWLTHSHPSYRPSVMFRPQISIDGNQWCALYGENLQDGVAGFGDSPALAMEAFDKAFQEKLDALPYPQRKQRPNPTLVSEGVAFQRKKAIQEESK